MFRTTSGTNGADVKRLLVVEDDALSRRLMCDLFRAQGYLVFEAADGEEALRSVEAAQPDVILLDLMMPKMDGLETCRRLKGDARTAAIPVLLVTALHERADRLKGMASGANDFITKPIDTEEVLLRVSNALHLKRLYDERNDLLRMRETLSDMIVHDLRNPLLGITLSAMRLKAQESSPEAQAAARDILEQSELIDRFINDLLDVARMEEASFKLNRSPVDVASLIRTVSDRHRPIAESKSITIQTDLPGTAFALQADETLLVRLLENLLANAVKFSPSNSTVLIRARSSACDSPACQICVEDEGPGVPIGYRELIFDKFSCIKMKDFSGRQTGLGLTFCRMVAEAHGGRIMVEARQPRGSAFVVELP